MSVAENISSIEEQIEKACLRSGRKREEISLMGVTKLQSPQAVDEAWKAGLRLFGENRVQEAAVKFEGFKEKYPGAELHLIGALQRNKAKAAAALFDCIQSLDRESLATELAKYTAGLSRPLPVLLEFRTGEDSKSGFTDIDALYRTVEVILGYPSLSIKGLMTIAPNTREEKLLRSAFRQLVAIRRELEQRYPAEGAWRCLSMGMSGDFEIAVEEGSTLLRIGTAIFGERT
jgi:pyridoxal phosphate enzyme (YggS family)